MADIANVENNTPQNSRAGRATSHAMADFHVGMDCSGKAYAIDKRSANPIALPLYGRAFGRRLRRDAYLRGDLLKKDEIGEVVEHLHALAAVQDQPLEVYHRVGPSHAGGIEIDLGTADGQRVRLQDGAATIVSRGSTTLFSRSETSQALPIPSNSGDWTHILPFLNMSGEHQLLFVACLTFYLCHFKGCKSSFPILVIKGEHGTGKSSLCKLWIRGLIDPNLSGVQTFPREPRELAITSQNQHVVIYDNLRHLTRPWSDTLCVAATGGSLSARKLYTDSEESMLTVHTPLVLNGIHSFITEADLASRTVTVSLDKLHPGQRQSDTELSRRYNEIAPALFKGILDLTAKTLQTINRVSPVYNTRLTEFTRWLAATEVVLGYDAGYLQDIYNRNVTESKLETLSENALAMSTISFAKLQGSTGWTGTPTQLLAELERLVDQKVVRQYRLWPQNPNSMSKRLKVVTGLLEEQGVFVEFRHSTERQILVAYKPAPQLTRTLAELDDPTRDQSSVMSSGSSTTLPALTPQ